MGQTWPKCMGWAGLGWADGPAQSPNGLVTVHQHSTSPRCILQQNVNYSRSACKCKAGQQEKKMIREQEGPRGGVEAVLAEAVLLSRWFQRRSFSLFVFFSAAPSSSYSFRFFSLFSLSSPFCPSVSLSWFSPFCFGLSPFFFFSFLLPLFL